MTASAYPDSPRGPWPVARPKRDTAIGAAFRQWRQRYRVSQSRLAEMLDVDHSLVTRWESGERTPSLDKVPVISGVTGWDERDVALLIAGYDAQAFRREIAAHERGRIVSAVQGALGEVDE